MDRLRQILRRIDGRGYPAYKDLKGTFRFESFDLDVVHVQGDPFAAPSRVAIRVPIRRLEIDAKDVKNPSRRMGLEDAVLRDFSRVIHSFRKNRGSGKSGIWSLVRLGQEIYPRTASELDDEELILRFGMGLPAAGRRILSHEAEEMFFEELPLAIRDGLFRANRKKWSEQMDANEDQEALRSILNEKNWVAFVSNGSVLPRASGIDDRPLSQAAVAWQSPPELEEEITLPHQGKIKGSAIPQGVTLICGGGYHGKSTLLQALSRAVYNHIPGDGREWVSSRYETVSIRAEDGRGIASVNISPFISKLPSEKDTKSFSSTNASGSTSQAANIIEALELGATSLLIDEDTSATNFMVRDRRMQELVETENEPITPFIDRAQEMYKKYNVSSVIVVGGSGDYFEIADTVIQMNEYVPQVSTDHAKEIASEYPSNRRKEERMGFRFPKDRVPLPDSFNPRQGRKAEKVKAFGTRFIDFGAFEIDVSMVSQLIDDGQTKTLGDWLLNCSRGDADGVRNLREICERIETQMKEGHLSATTARGHGDRVFTRRFELAAAINRLRSTEIRSF